MNPSIIVPYMSHFRDKNMEKVAELFKNIVTGPWLSHLAQMILPCWLYNADHKNRSSVAFHPAPKILSQPAEGGWTHWMASFSGWCDSLWIFNRE